MKFKLLILILIIGFLSIDCLAQERNFSIEISLKENNRLSFGKDNLVTVKITNKSEQILNTKDLKFLNFYLSKCPRIKKCSTREDVFIASSAVDAKNLKQNESLEVQVNLADLYWNPSISSSIDFNYPKNLSTVPLTNKYFQADIKFFEKYLKLEKQSIQIPISKSYESNEIVLQSLFNTSK